MGVPAGSIATAEGVSEEYCTTDDASSQLSSCREQTIIQMKVLTRGYCDPMVNNKDMVD